MAAADMARVGSALPGSGLFGRSFRFVESRLDRFCGAQDNPLRQLGGLGFYLFWLIALSGTWVYVVYETSVDGAHASIEWLTHEQWWAGGLMRSLHRYASDAFVAVVVLHLLRELVYGRFTGFRWYSWVSGVVTLWPIVASGVIGYWLVWDTVAQFVATTTAEWFGVLPGFGPGLVRNFIASEAVSDRLFSLLIFLHIGVPLVLLLAMWAHVQRITRPRTSASRAVALWTLGALVALSFALPAVSQAPADLDRVPASLPIDWFYLAPLPAVDAWSAELVWIVTVGATLLLGVAPWLRRVPRLAPARVDPANCNGCTRCFADCPYAAIEMAPHPGGRGQIAVVDEDRCAACGICAGACPSATPFRSGERLVSGIDLPWLTVGALRDEFDAVLAQAGARQERWIAVFGCEHAAQAGPSQAGSSPAGVHRFVLPCAGMLPPSFIEYALRAGAQGVVVAACQGDDCEFRLGQRWTSERIAGEREPHLRTAVNRQRVLVVESRRGDDAGSSRRVAEFSATLAAMDSAARMSGESADRPAPDGEHRDG